MARVTQTPCPVVIAAESQASRWEITAVTIRTPPTGTDSITIQTQALYVSPTGQRSQPVLLDPIGIAGDRLTALVADALRRAAGALGIDVSAASEAALAGALYAGIRDACYGYATTAGQIPSDAS